METPTGVARSPQLPAYASKFIGRSRELTAVSALLKRSRLVTLTGPPGTGKTRLAIEFALRDGWVGEQDPTLVELAPLAEASLLAETFAAALGVSHSHGKPAHDRVIARLSASGGLVVVDNCEHLIEATASLIDTILRRCPDVTVLATSREPLRVDGEAVLPVPPMGLPPEHSSMPEMRRSEAVRLFVDRARQATPGFQLSKASAPQVDSICRRLDGLPLAIEVAAARVAAVDLATIDQQLQDRFRFLTGGFRTAPPRHRTLRAAIDWSYDLLTVAERQLLMRLGIFAGSFDVAAVEHICVGGAVTEGQLLDLIGRLVDKSLVAPVEREGEIRRYFLLLSLRAYALDRLAEQGELDIVRHRHALYYMTVVDDRRQIEASWIPQVGLEMDNLREALAWSRGRDDELHLGLASSFGQYCMTAGYIQEGRAWLEAALAAARPDSQAVARADGVAAHLAWRSGDADAAERFAIGAVRIARAAGDEIQLAEALGNLAFVQIGAGRFDGVPAMLDEELAIARRRGDEIMEGDALGEMGLLLAHGDDAAAARDLFARSIELYEAAGRADEAAMHDNGLAWMYLRLNSLSQARAALTTGLQIRLRRHQTADTASSLESAAELSFLEGAPERAMRLIGAADALREAWGSVPPSLALASRARWMPLAEELMGDRARALRREGARLTLDEAARYALAPRDDAPPRAAGVAGPALTGREMRVAELVAKGLSNDEIATRLRISRRTVEAHLDHVRTKLGARSRVEVATWVTARSLPPPTWRS